MKKVSKKVQSTKLNESKYFSLNGNMLKIKGGHNGDDLVSNTDRTCNGGCGATSAFVNGGIVN
ncbi:MAG: hypothetical protein LBJ63_09395 [Prevotellaceae bacterium]|jgi:hypothetical protein|nr:hypothetical protein [Prevotellaceae bacterium]